MYRDASLIFMDSPVSICILELEVAIDVDNSMKTLVKNFCEGHDRR